MADTFTTTLSLTKPEVGASADTWGTKLNDNLDDIDALFSAGPVLKVANGGTAATTASGARTNLGLGTMATQDASAVAITGGTAVLTGTVGVQVTADSPRIVLYETDAATDEKRWTLESVDGAFSIYAIDDAYGTSVLAMSASRTGTTVDSIALTATAVTINGNAAWHAGNDGAGSGLDADTVDGLAPTSGSFTVTLRPSNGGATLASGTATWKKFNGVVSLFIPQLLTTNTSAALYLDDLSADVQPSTSQICHAFGESAGNPVPIRVQFVSDYALMALADNSGFATSATSKGIYASTLTYIV